MVYQGVDVTLKDMLMLHGHQFENFQTRLISGHNPALKNVGETALEVAIENIEKYFAFVGITERFDESIVLATHDLGWKIVSYSSRNTARQWTDDFSKDLEADNDSIDILMGLNDLDQRLYKYVDARLSERLHRFSPDLGAQMETLKQLREQPRATVAVGSLGSLRRKRIVGWAKLKNMDSPARLKVTINDIHEFIVNAVIKREDLRPQCFSGACGFMIALPESLWLKPGDVVRASVINANDKELGNSPRVFAIDL
jgi:hypothetical protein